MLSKEDDFIGRAVLEQRKEHPQKKLVGVRRWARSLYGAG